ncbi:MAG: hypothetical protein AB7I79_06780 [Rhizobiaceae bacterium]
MNRQAANFGRRADVPRRQAATPAADRRAGRRITPALAGLPNVYAPGDFENFVGAVFDRVEKQDGVLVLASGDNLVFYLPVEKLAEPLMQQAIFNFVAGRHRLDA